MICNNNNYQGDKHRKVIIFLVFIFVVSGDLIVINRFCSTIDNLKVQQGCQFNPDKCEKFNEGMKL